MDKTKKRTKLLIKQKAVTQSRMTASILEPLKMSLHFSGLSDFQYPAFDSLLLHQHSSANEALTGFNFQ
jgi:hypothetical protein